MTKRQFRKRLATPYVPTPDQLAASAAYKLKCAEDEAIRDDLRINGGLPEHQPGYGRTPRYQRALDRNGELTISKNGRSMTIPNTWFNRHFPPSLG